VKILFTVDSLRRGGKERRLVELLRDLSSRDQEFKLIVFSNRIEYSIDHFASKVIILKKAEEQSQLKLWVDLIRIINSYKPDIVHSWDRLSSLMILPSILIRKTPLLCSIINDVSPSPPKAFSKKWFAHWLLKCFSTRILSNTNLGLLTNRVGKKGLCIYNGFDFNRISNLRKPEEVKRSMSINTRYVVGMVGAIEPRKDFKAFISCAKQILATRNDITFLIVGDGQYRQELENSIYEEKRIIFTGKLDNIEHVMNIFDIGILLTNQDVHGEGISNTIMEYMALGKPVIATQGGGNHEIVAEGVSGFLISENRKDLIIDKILFLIDNPEVAGALGKKGRQIVVEKFEMSRMTKEFMELYCSSAQNR